MNALTKDEFFTGRLPRRALTFTVLAVLLALSLPALLVALPWAAYRDYRVSRQRSCPSAYVRSVLMLVTWIWMEAIGVTVALLLTPLRLAGRSLFVRTHRALQRWWVTSLVGAMKRIFNLRLEVTGGEALNELPGVLLVRHSSLMDTLLPALVLTDRGAGIRYVLKRELLLDPCLDLVGCRLPNAFVRRSGDTRRELEVLSNLGRTTSASESVVIYPEGTRYTPRRRAQLIDRLADKGSERLALAQALSHTLPPRAGGTLALLKHLDNRPVVVVSHTGFEGAAQVSDVFDGYLVGRRIALRLWRIDPSALPEDDDARKQWLDAWWERVDAWVEQNHPKPHRDHAPGQLPVIAR